MQRDNDLNQLFRARLPIAALPQDFAERLTKAILDEVAHLRQSTLLSTHRLDHDGDNPGEYKAVATPTRHLLTKSTTAILLFLFINCYLGTFLQGCSLTIRVPSSTHAFIATQAHSRTAGKISAQGAMMDKMQSGSPEAVIAGLTNTGHTLHLPPLWSLKPKLPILHAMQRPKILLPEMFSTLDSSSVTLHDPPGAEQPSAPIITVTMLYGHSVGQAEPQEKQPTSTALSPENLDPVATPTANTPITDIVETPIPSVFSPTPILNIFEPTTTPAGPDPTPTAAEQPTATPTIFIRPWPTNDATTLATATETTPVSPLPQP